MMKVFRIGSGEILRCSECHCWVSYLYVLAETWDEALDIINGGGGLCGDCLCEMLIESGYEVVLEN